MNTRLAIVSSKRVAKSSRQSKSKSKSSKVTSKRKLKFSLLAINLALVAGTLFFVIQRPHAQVASESVGTGSDSVLAANPLDQLASANIAVTVARLGNMPEVTAVTNQADSQEAELSMAASGTSIMAKPQVVNTSLKTRADIKTYITQPGDTVTKIAAKFGITSDSIMWSNGLNSDSLAPNQKILIPPVNGIIYIVQKGDTAASLASKFNTDQSKIIAFNDAEISGLRPGEKIVIPSGIETSGAPLGGLAWGSSPVYGYNGYDWGNCTWYVASQIAVPSNWGNAATWSYYAALSGWRVSSMPTVGAIAQTPYAAGGLGHVAIVTGVHGNTVEFTDMNNYGDGGGYGRVGHGSAPISEFPNYISR